MKRIAFALIVATSLLATACSSSTTPTAPVVAPEPVVDYKPGPATTAKAGDAVKAAVDQLISLAQQGDCKSMAPLIVLSDSGTPDDWNRSLRYETSSERVMADKQCASLQVLVADLKSHRFVEFSQEDESEGQWNIWTVELLYHDGSTENHAFAFLPQGNGYLLGDID